MGQKVAGTICGHDLGVSLIEECQGTAGRTGIDGLPQPVEYEHRLIEQCIHDLVTENIHEVSSFYKLLSMNRV